MIPELLARPGARRRLARAALVAALLPGCGPAARASAPGELRAAPPEEASLALKVQQFAPATLTADTSRLDPSERAALARLIEAARLMEPIFERQVHAGNPAVRARLTADRTPEGKLKLDYFNIMRGPWDRQDQLRPFAIDRPHPPGAGFYPEDLTADAFHGWIERHPGDKERFESPFTLLRRDGDRLVAIQYSEAYAPWLGPAAEKLQEAAALTRNESLRRFLLSRAAAFRSNDYHASEKDWMDVDSEVEATIGPYETYEDELLALKASFQAFVTVSVPEASRELSRYEQLLPEMEKNLPIPDGMKTARGAESPIQVVDLVFSSGDARKSVQTVAFSLPNDERVRAEKGAKKVLLRNVIEIKLHQILRPIAERILDPAQLEHLSADAFFTQTLFHELSHNLGPAFATAGRDRVEVRSALGASHAALEEAKADVMGAHNILFLIRRGDIPPGLRDKVLVSYFAALFRSVRFGVADAFGKGAALQINRFLEEQAARFDPTTRRFTVRLDALEAAISRLVRDICVLQHGGDRKGAEALLSRHGVVSEPIRLALGQLGGIPVDIRPVYPLAGE
ncbi:dipeptidyl-peptidase 3 family protein [Sorangium sp. So ce1389]|uniref:dipeptidyl-peptidase 3 family protein n=1 Tax=Sorangium sp. So ce1389 TaxID=3133336 RepID=UPI003F5DB114